MTSIPVFRSNGIVIPRLGFGTGRIGDKTSLDGYGELVTHALKLGYRHIDTAWKYKTEKAVGEGIRASGVPRNEIFLTTKVSHEYLRADDVARMVDESLKNLAVDYVDLLMVHWPSPDNVPLSETMAALAKAKRQGKNRVQRHQLVYKALGERMREEIHALSMRTLTPDEARGHGPVEHEFGRIDRNGDGRISLQEFIQGRLNKPQPRF